MRGATLWLVLTLLGFPIVYGLAATAGALINMSNGQLDQEGEIEILLVAGPIHYDFLLPLNPKTREQFRPERPLQPTSPVPAAPEPGQGISR